MIKDSISKLLIYGVGLMGASLALGVRNAHPHIRLSGIVRSDRSKKICQDMNIFDDIFKEEEISYFGEGFWDQFDMIVFGTPVHSIKMQVTRIPTSCNAIITDMGSTKQTILDSVESHYSNLPIHNYVSSHPMCGSENAGPESAIPDLYKNKLCIITPLPNSNHNAITIVTEFWKSLGMDTYSLDGNSHDKILAYLSHTPHILSSLMVLWAEAAVGRENKSSPQPIMGGGFRDMARIAGSNPEMWQSIVGENQDSILESLRAFRDKVDQAIELIEKGNSETWHEFFQSASDSKKSLLKTS